MHYWCNASSCLKVVLSSTSKHKGLINYYTLFFLQLVRNSLCFTVYREIIGPWFFCSFFPRCQRVNLRHGEFLCLKLSLFIHNLGRAKSRRSKTNCKWKTAKINRGENYPAFSIFFLQNSSLESEWGNVSSSSWPFS